MRFAVTRCANKSGQDYCGAEDTIPQKGNIDKRLPICYLDSSENNIKTRTIAVSDSYPTLVHYKAEARVRCVVEKTWALQLR